MNSEQKIRQAEHDIHQALQDYGRYTTEQSWIPCTSDEFIHRLAVDNFFAKRELRSFFRKSPAWNESRDALEFDGVCNKTPDPNRIMHLAEKILEPVITEINQGDYPLHVKDSISDMLLFFTLPQDNSKVDKEYIECLNFWAPKAYAPGKKLSRIFRDVCKRFGLVDESPGSDFQKLFAMLSDELNSKMVHFKLFVSLNPAHILTMSNPKFDRRGSMLTSCHSLNCSPDEASYPNGCVGYARDKYSFIAFTVADLLSTESFYNRKTSRQIYAYQPRNGLLLQSRMYNTSGGTYGAQNESDAYGKLIRCEIASLEGFPDEWECLPSSEYCHDYLEVDENFGGYCDWECDEFDGKLFIQTDRIYDCSSLKIGAPGLCVHCAREINNNMFCENCN